MIGLTKHVYSEAKVYIHANTHIGKEPEKEVAPRKKVLISGCYDLLHSGSHPLSTLCYLDKKISYWLLTHTHNITRACPVLQRSVAIGGPHVSVVCDQTIMQLKGRSTMIPEAERLFMVQSIKYVHYAEISQVCSP